jgi:hypothetical protein
MASIDIFPLSINGVQPPLNMLAQIIGNTGATSNFRYPLDLGSNPNYGHSVTFTALNRKFLGLQTGLNANNFKPNTLLNQTQETSAGTVSLYMPDTLNVNYSHNYGEVSLTEQLGPIATLASAFADRSSSMRGMDGDTGNWWNPYAAGAGTYALGKIGQMGDVAPGLGDVAQNAIGNVTNPHLQMLYKGVGLREFQFEFLFTPTSSQEAQQAKTIVDTFVYWAAPDVAKGVSSSRHYLVPPLLFNIGFSFLNGSGLVGAVTNFFSNLETQIFGQQLTGALNPSSSLSTPLNNAMVYTIYHPCVLKDINVDYAPNGWAAFSDGFPVQTRLTLQFKETDIVTKQDINPSVSNFQQDIQNMNSIAQQDATNQLWGNPTSSPAKVYAQPSSIPGSL